MPVKPLVLITNDTPLDHLRPLEGLAEVIRGPAGGRLMPRAEVLELAPRLDAIINQAELIVDAELLDTAPNLRIVANVAMGTDNFDLALMSARGVWATNVAHLFTEPTAEHTLGLLLAVARRIPEADQYVRSRQWSEDGFQPGVWDGMLLSGKTLGIIGYGHIGKAVAARAQAFGMRIIYHDRNGSEADPAYRELNALLEKADVVSLHVPYSGPTHHLLDAAQLDSVKPGALLLNLSRGKVVNEAALVHALESGRLGGAGLDVFEDEPRVHPALLAMPNVVLTPHVGGGSKETRAEARRLSAENVALVLEGKRPRTPCNEPRNTS